jgi:hypothetical protein
LRHHAYFITRDGTEFRNKNHLSALQKLVYSKHWCIN